MLKVGILIVFGAAMAAIIVCEPSWLTHNSFLRDFIGHEILALMAVVLTVTLASVANIHLSLNRMVLERFNNKSHLKESAKSVKKHINEDAWYIFFGFIFSVMLLILKGAFDTNPHIVALAYGGILWVLLLDIVSMYDIYKVVFGLVELELEIGNRDKAE